MSQTTAEPRPEPSVDIRLLIVLRTLAVLGQALAVVMADWVMGLSLPVGMMALVIAALALFNGAVWWRLRPSYHVAPGTATAHLTLDVLALALLLYFSGGGTNPFVTVFLLPLIIAATILPERWTWTLTGVTVACYSLVLLWYEPVDWPSAWRAFELHVLGMWLAFVLSAAVVASFVVAMARRLRERERQLERERERARRDSAVVALGSLAAQSVHELGNPLATIDLLALELEEMAIVVLTAYASIATAVEAIKLGAVHYLAKPVHPDAVVASLGSQGGDASVGVDDEVPSVRRLEWEHIQRVLEACDGNVSAAARQLGMHRRTLQRKLQKRPVKQ